MASLQTSHVDYLWLATPPTPSTATLHRIRRRQRCAMLVASELPFPDHRFEPLTWSSLTLHNPTSTTGRTHAAELPRVRASSPHEQDALPRLPAPPLAFLSPLRGSCPRCSAASKRRAKSVSAALRPSTSTPSAAPPRPAPRLHLVLPRLRSDVAEDTPPTCRHRPAKRLRFHWRRRVAIYRYTGCSK
jgi:hypothetical protein